MCHGCMEKCVIRFSDSLHPLIFPKVLACIGEQFTEGNEVCGIAVNIRPKGDRIELWTKNAANEAAQVP